MGTRPDGSGRESLVYRIEASAFATGLGGPTEPLEEVVRTAEVALKKKAKDEK